MLFETILLPEAKHLTGKTITIDNTAKTKVGLFKSYGEQIYTDRTEFNPISPGFTYFGNNFDAFWDCLFSLKFQTEMSFHIVHHCIPNIGRRNQVIYASILLGAAVNSPLERSKPILLDSLIPNLFVYFLPEIQTVEFGEIIREGAKFYNWTLD